MRIYRVNVEHKTHGTHWNHFKVAANNFEGAVKEAQERLEKKEIIESIELLASTD
jgi:hypothetical protein